MTHLKKIVAAAGFTLSFAGLGALATPAWAMPAGPLAQTDAPLAPGPEHVQYYGGYGYGYPCVFPLRCGYGYYGPRYYGGYYGGRGYYGRGFYGRGYGYGRGFRR